MNNQLRSDEEFVIRSVANHFLGSWWPGQNPPDAYLQVGKEIIAVEISTLTQHVSDGRGGSKPRRSEDSTAIWLVNALNEELQTLVPDGWIVILNLASPILKAKKSKIQLKERISNLFLSACDCEIEEVILGNRIGIKVVAGNRQGGKKVVGVIWNSNSSKDILNNAWNILENRIVEKARKCKCLPFEGPKWLVLLNDYCLADNDIYQQAFNSFSADHPFEKILLASGNGSVAALCNQAAQRP